MCALGHHEHADSIPPPAARKVRAPRLTRAEIAANKEKLTAALEAEVAPPDEDAFHGNAQMELIPAGLEDMPEHIVDRRQWWVNRD